MPDPQITSSPILGLDKPFTGKDVNKPGVDSETGLFEGIHPENNERISVTLQALQAQFGETKGEEKYLKIAGVRGGSVFFNPNAEATNFRPPLGLKALKAEDRALVDEILNAKE